MFYGRIKIIAQVTGGLPKMAAVIACTCRFTPVHSSVIGLRAASALSIFLVKAAFSVAQSARSFLKPSFSCSILPKVMVNSSLALEVSACCDFKRSVIWLAWAFSSACSQNSYTVQQKEVPTTIQVLRVALGG